MTRRSPLSFLFDLAAQLEADAGRDPAELHRRDRALGQEIEASGFTGDARVAVWLDRVRPPHADDIGERAARARAALTVLLVGLGLAIGAGTAAALFTYDGTHPVNAVRVLAVFVVLQLALVAGTVVLLLPEPWRRRVPGLSALQDALSLLSPGRWQGAFRRLLPQNQREGLDRAVGLARAHGRLYGDVQKLTLLAASQAFGVAFHVGALVCCLSLVSFTDLAFGWSTTLDVDVRALHTLVGWLAWPWAGWLPDATPSFALVETTQYFRGRGHAGDPAASAPWWRFLFAAMLAYGLLPRVVLLGVTTWGRATAIARAVHHTPGAAALRERFDTEFVETVADVAETGGPMPARPPAQASLPLPTREPCALVLWSGLGLDEANAREAAGRLSLAVSEVLRAGDESLAADAETVRRAAAGEGAVAVLVKAWEPPVLEFVDFLGDLREALGNGRPIAVLPVVLDARDRAASPKPEDALQWQRRLDAAGDPWLSVHVLAPEAS